MRRKAKDFQNEKKLPITKTTWRNITKINIARYFSQSFFSRRKQIRLLCKDKKKKRKKERKSHELRCKVEEDEKYKE